MFAFGDSFDITNNQTDFGLGYWDVVGGSSFSPNQSTTRFGIGRSIAAGGAGNYLMKNSNQNDRVHHLNLAYMLPSALSGTFIWYFTLQDGGTAQCTVGLRSDGAIVLQSGAQGGTQLAIWTTAITASNTWHGFEIEVNVHATAGSITIRRDGNLSNDYQLTGLATALSANNYANRLQMGFSALSGGGYLDDFLWRSDPTSVPWVGDVRAYVRYPYTDVQAQFSKSPTTQTYIIYSPGNAAGPGANVLQFMPFVAPATIVGPVQQLITHLFTSSSFGAVMGLYDNSGTGGAPGNLLANGTTTALSSTGSGDIAFTFPTPPTLVPGNTYYMAINSANSISVMGNNPDIGNTYRMSYTYTGSLPSTAAGATLQPTGLYGCVRGLVATPMNAVLVSEQFEDGTSTYVYDNTVNDADFYTIGSIPVTPAATVCLTTRGFMQKSDTGPRSGAIQLRSGATTAFAPTTWNPSDVSSVTLSGGNLIATSSAAGGVRSVAGVTTGKYYWEVTLGTAPTQFETGLANSSAVLSTVNGTATNACIIVGAGNIYVNGLTIVGSIGSMTSSLLCCIAYDAGAKRIWFRNGATGSWNATSGTANDPVAGTGGIDVSAIAATALYALFSPAAAASATANFGATAFSGAVPSGYTSGFGGTTITGTVVQSPAMPLSTSFNWTYRTDLTDPATSAAWTPTAVNNLQVGPIVVS